MRRPRTRNVVALVLIALVIVLSGLFLAYRYFSNAGSISSKEIGNGVTVTGSNMPGNMQATLSQIQAPYNYLLATPLSPTYQVSPSGALKSPVTIQLPLTRAVSRGSKLIVMTSESSGGQWTPLMATLSQDGKSVSVGVDHLSIFDVELLNMPALLNDFKSMFLDAFIPDSFQGATPPTCQNESQARQENYGIRSTPSPHVLYWCFGIENGKRVLKVVNNRVFPISIQHPGLNVTNVSQPPFLQYIEQLDANLRQEVLLLPGGEADFTADPGTGKQGVVHTQWDAGAEMIIGFETAVDTPGTIFSFSAIRRLLPLRRLDQFWIMEPVLACCVTL